MQVKDKAPGDEEVQTPDIPVSDEPSMDEICRQVTLWQNQGYCHPPSFPPLPSTHQEQETQRGEVLEVAGPLQELCREVTTPRPSPTWWMGSWLLIQDDRMHSTQHPAMWIKFTWADIVSKTWTTKFCQIPHINMCLGLIAPWHPHWQCKTTETEKIIERVNMSKTGILEMRMDNVFLSQNLPILSQVEFLRRSSSEEVNSETRIWEQTAYLGSYPRWPCKGKLFIHNTSGRQYVGYLSPTSQFSSFPDTKWLSHI